MVSGAVSIECDPTLLKSPAAPDSERSREWMGRVRDGVKARLFAPDGPIPTSGDEALAPARIGRFVVIKRIGAGGMGLIYAAYDDKLDRKVAVKLLRPERTGESGQARLLREAQALARLSHRCVIQVYEVGTHEDEVFIAMEYVDGVTLKEWQGNHGWREILEAYVASGEGLVAAHRAGIVHRDFKADNVLVREDGSVRVLDFGLAQTALAETDDDFVTPQDDAPVDEELPLTRTGAVMGTPAYMAPEQHVAGPIDARTDQFSFCVSLYEALYGYRPFAGSTMEELRRNVIAGTFEISAHFTEVPPLIRRALERGLSVEPNDRFGSLAELLEQLNPPAPRKRWLAASVGGGVLLAGAIGATWLSGGARAKLDAQGDLLRFEFAQARMVSAEDELERLNNRTVSERWDDLVLTYAEGISGKDPTVALAALKHLSPSNVDWLDGARTIASDASRRAPVFARTRELGGLTHLQFDDDATHVLGLDARGTAWTWRVDDGVVAEARVEGVVFADVAFGNTDSIIAAGSDGALHRMNRDGAALGRVEVGDAPLISISAAGEGYGDVAERVALGDNAGKITIVEAGEEVESFMHGTSPVRSLAFHINGNELASGSEDGTVRLWFLKRRSHWTLETGDPIERLMWTQAGSRLDARTSKSPASWSEDEGVAIPPTAPEGTREYAVSWSGGVGVGVDAEDRLQLFVDGAPTQELSDEGGTVLDTAMGSDGQRVAVSTADELRVWQPRSRDGAPQFGGEATFDVDDVGPLVGIAALPDRRLVTVSERGTIVELRPDGTTSVVADVELDVNTIQLAPDGHTLALETLDGNLHAIDLDNPTGLRGLGQHNSAFVGVYVWSPTSDAIAKAHCNAEGLCRIAHHPANGDAPRTLGVFAGRTDALRFSPDGKFLLTDHSLAMFLWDVEEGDGMEVELPGAPPRVARSRVGFAFVGDKNDIRVATLEAGWKAPKTERPERTLRVWQSGDTRHELHEVFAEPGLRVVGATRDAEALVFETSDERDLVWFVDTEQFHLLPKDALPSEATIMDLRVSDDRNSVMLELDDAQFFTAFDLRSGNRRRFPLTLGPTTWLDDGTLVDVARLRRVRIWVDATPNDSAAFLAWLSGVTRTTVESSSLR